jgi:hypothetical protein
VRNWLRAPHDPRRPRARSQSGADCSKLPPLARSACDVCGGEGRGELNMPGATDDVSPPLRCRDHLRVEIPQHALDFSHSMNNFSVHAGVTEGRLASVRAPHGGYGVMDAPVVGSPTLLTVNVGLNAGMMASLLGIAMQARMGRPTPSTWVVPGSQRVADELCLSNWTAQSTHDRPDTTTSPSLDDPSLMPAVWTAPISPSEFAGDTSAFQVDATPLESSLVGDPLFDGRQSHCLGGGGGPAQRPQAGAGRPEDGAPGEWRRASNGGRAEGEFVGDSLTAPPNTMPGPSFPGGFGLEERQSSGLGGGGGPVPRRRRGDGLPEGTPEERRKASNRRSAARASARRLAAFQNLTETLAESKAEAVRLLRRERLLRDENFQLRRLVSALSASVELDAGVGGWDAMQRQHPRPQ